MDHFHWIAPVYDRLCPTPDPERLLRLLEVPVDGRLLDVGGGTGRVAQGLRGVAGEVLVLDEAVGMLRQAHAKGLVAVRGHAERLPWPDGAFSRILLVDCLHHLRDQSRAASELLRILAPGGRIVIEEPNVEQRSARLIALGEKLLLMRSHFLSPQEVERLFQAAGGEVRLEREGMSFWAVVLKAEGPRKP